SSGLPPASGFWLAAEATFASISRSIFPYGRAASARSCAFRSRAAEIIFMALVICCVLRIERTRRRMSIRLGILLGLLFLDEAGLEFAQGRSHLPLQRVVQRLLFANGRKHSGMRILDK